MIAIHTTNARRLPLVLISILVFGAVQGAQAAAGEWQPGPNAVLDNSYTGYVDVPVGGSTVSAAQSLVVAGWVVDRTAEGWAGIDDLHVYDGLAGQGKFLGKALVAQSRPDVAQALGNPYWANSGFALILPASSLAPGAHTLTIYAHSPVKGWWSTQDSFTIGATAPAAAPAPAAGAPASALPGPINVILSPSGVAIARNQDHYSIKGYALDPNAPNGDIGIDRVDVYLDEQRNQSDSKFIGHADVGHNSVSEAANLYGMRFFQSGWQIDFKPNSFDVGNHHIYAYAHSTVTDKETLAIAGFNLSATP